MTQQQPQQEYIIDLTSLNPKDPVDERWADSFARNQSENIILDYRGKKIKIIVSDVTRPLPHTRSTEAPCTKCPYVILCSECPLILAEHDTAIRNATLDIIERWVIDNNVNYVDIDGDTLPAIVTGRLLNKIESLRSTQERAP